jgi:phosphatidylglycerophosphate synthase
VLARLLALPLKVEPLLIGKANTVVQVCYVALMLLMLTRHVDVPALETAGAVTSAVFAIASGLAYAQLLVRAIGFRAA